MRAIQFLLCVLFSCSYVANAQVSVTGSTSPISTDDDASPVVVDDQLTIEKTNTIDGATVSISYNFVTGDSLNYTAALPNGVTTSGYNPVTGTLTFTGIATAAEYQALLRSVTFRAVASGTPNRQIQFRIGAKNFFGPNNHFYEYVATSSPISWTDARNAAAAKKYYGTTGYLATMTTSSENDFLFKSLPNDGWIGGSDDYNVINSALAASAPKFANQDACEGKFYWVTGPEAGTQFSRDNAPSPKATPPYNYQNWNGGEPNNSGGENFAEFVVSYNNNGRWNDMNESGWSQIRGYFIEYGGVGISESDMDVVHTREITVKPTIISTTPAKNYYTQFGPQLVDYAITVKSGGLITNAKISIVSNFFSGDILDIPSGYPSGMSGEYKPTTGTLEIKGTAKPSEWQALFRKVVFKTTSTDKSDRMVGFSIGNIIAGDNGHFYEFVDLTKYTWREALDAAAARSYMGLQGYLATITSQSENDLINYKLRADGWLGGSDEYSTVNDATISTKSPTKYTSQDQSEGRFYWVTGPEKGQLISTGDFSPVPATPTTFMKWYNKLFNFHDGEEPNNAGGEHFLEIYSTRAGAPGQWNDMPNSSPLGMVVEYGGLPTDPSLSVSSSRILTLDPPPVLPVSDISLQVKEKENSVLLTWNVYQEVNVSHYNIMRSINGSAFKKIGEVTALDNDGKTSYTFSDNDALEGTNTYMIVIVDEDGKQSYSEKRVLVIKSKLQLYPTVVSDYLNIYQSYKAESLARITNASGALCLEQVVKPGSNRLNTSSLARGVYFVQIFNSTLKPRIYKILKP